MKGTSNKVKTSMDLFRYNLPKLLRWVIVLSAYLVLFSLLDQLSKTLQLFPGVVAWYPPDGLSLAFLLTFGAAFTPAFTLASLISSLIIYHFSATAGEILAWAVGISVVYGINAWLLRRWVRINPQLKNLRDTLWLIFSSAIISTFLAVIAVSTFVKSGTVPSYQYFNAFVQWWIGEMIGVLVLTPFLLIHVMPRLKRFIDGERTNSKPQKAFGGIALQTIGQVVSILVSLYLVFGVPALREFRPYFLIAVPLIWIALRDGLAKVSLAIVVMNFGTILAVWLFRIDYSRVGELQFLMCGICTGTLLVGAVVSRQKSTEEELRRREVRNRALIENAPDAIILLGADGLLKYLSPATQRILGYTPEEWIGSDPAILIHPDDLPSRQKILGDLSQTPGVVGTTQYRLRHKDGTWRWLESTITNLLAEPSVEALVINFRDISERKQSEAAIREAESKYRAIFENSIEGIFQTTPAGQYITANYAQARMYGYDSSEELMASLSDLNRQFYVEPTRREEFRKFLEEHDIIRGFESEVYRKDGTKMWVSENGRTIRDKNGTILYYEGTTENITDRKQSEETLQKSEKRFRSLVEHSLEEVSLVDTNGILIYESPTTRRPLGYPPDSFKGHSLFDLFHPEERELAARLMEDVIKHPGSVREAVFRLRHQDGSWRWMEGVMTNLLDEPAVQSIVINYRDVTERKEAEEEIKLRNAELSMLFELSHSLAEADNLEDILDLVNRHAVESIQVTFSRIALLEEGNFVMQAAYPIRAIGHDLRIGERNPVASLPYSQRILEKNVPAILLASNAEIGDEEKELLLLDFAQSLCFVPLRTNDPSPLSMNLLGVLMLGEARSESREPFTPKKLRLIQSIGDSAAIAIRRMLLREQTERNLQQLISLSEIDQAIISSSNMALSLKVLLSHATVGLKADAADVWVFNPTLRLLEFICGHGFKTQAFESVEPLHLGEGHAGRAALERQIIHVPNLTADTDHPRLTKALAIEPFVDYFAVPLIVKGQVKGVLELFHRTTLDPNEEWLKFLNALAGQAAIAIDNFSLYNNLQRSNLELAEAYDATIQGWSRALDLRDKETEGHTQRVTELTIKLGRQFGLSDEELVHLRRGALLHDIGKMGVPDGILLKPGPLTDEEWVMMKKHTTFAFEMLTPIDYLRHALDIPYCHHEKWDGTGYPRGLRGEQIPFAARIFAVVDVWDALTSVRPYRAAWPEKKALEHIRSLAGTQFDPQVVKICLEAGGLIG